MKYGLVFSILIISLAIFSCSKDGGDCETTTANLAGTYKLTTLKYALPGFPEQDYMSSLPACAVDDLEVLNANGTYEHQDVGTACSPNASTTGTWSLSGNTIVLGTRTFTIQSFDCSRLVAFFSPNIVTGDKATATFTKQ
jgi:hypothetical protein